MLIYVNKYTLNIDCTKNSKSCGACHIYIHICMIIVKHKISFTFNKITIEVAGLKFSFL